ncbi:MAG: hypothetical protein RLZZ449_1354 [Actinomycetota bacterium]
MVRAGVGESFLLANETLDTDRLSALAAVQHDALIMVIRLRRSRQRIGRASKMPSST